MTPSVASVSWHKFQYSVWTPMKYHANNNFNPPTGVPSGQEYKSSPLFRTESLEYSLEIACGSRGCFCGHQIHEILYHSCQKRAVQGGRDTEMPLLKNCRSRNSFRGALQCLTTKTYLYINPQSGPLESSSFVLSICPPFWWLT